MRRRAQSRGVEKSHWHEKERKRRSRKNRTAEKAGRRRLEVAGTCVYLEKNCRRVRSFPRRAPAHPSSLCICKWATKRRRRGGCLFWVFGQPHSLLARSLPTLLHTTHTTTTALLQLVTWRRKACMTSLPASLFFDMKPGQATGDGTAYNKQTNLIGGGRGRGRKRAFYL